MHVHSARPLSLCLLVWELTRLEPPTARRPGTMIGDEYIPAPIDHVLRRQPAVQRLRHHRNVLVSRSETATTTMLQRSTSPHLAEQMTLPRQLYQDDSGFLVSEDVAMLEKLEAEAASRRDYRLAAQLRDTLDVLTPRPGGALTLADFSPEGVSAQLSCFWQNGFVVLHGLLQGEALERARAAWLCAEPSYRDKYVGSGAAHGEPGNNFVFNIPNLMELDDAFVNLSDHPKLVGVMQHVAGAGGLDDDSPTPSMDRRYHGVMRLVGGNCSIPVQCCHKSQLSYATLIYYKTTMANE